MSGAQGWAHLVWRVAQAQLQHLIDQLEAELASVRKSRAFWKAQPSIEFTRKGGGTFSPRDLRLFALKSDIESLEAVLTVMRDDDA